jgi:hypothetical protein
MEEAYKRDRGDSASDKQRHSGRDREGEERGRREGGRDTGGGGME